MSQEKTFNHGDTADTASTAKSKQAVFCFSPCRRVAVVKKSFHVFRRVRRAAVVKKVWLFAVPAVSPWLKRFAFRRVRRVAVVNCFFHSGGFVLPSAIFLLVILALLAAFMVVFSQMQNVTSVQDLQGARAYQAARAGIQWGLYKVIDPENTTVVAPGDPTWPSMPPCANGNLTIEGFSVTVSCTSWPDATGTYAENGGNHQVRVYRLTSRAQSGTVGTMGYVEREVEVTVSKCRAVDGAAPGYECP
ncbi:hypothetical protein AGMMS50256_23300 [Betaproteobacteria bacterium]|nr:hypothetical protein AGMMS50256_23300 [Betaproteobacteria bacterium]